MEEWKPLPQMPRDYEISSSGRLRRVSATRGSRVGRIRAVTKDRRGYVVYILNLDGQALVVLAHRAVASAFIGPIAPGMQVNHKNGDKSDCRVENLEIVTAGENRAHSYRVLGVAPNRAALVGANNHRAKLDWASVDYIRRAHADGSQSYSALANRFNVTKQAIASIVKQETWREADRPPATQ